MMDTISIIPSGIAVKRAFGMLVYWSGIIRRPMSTSIPNVPAIITCLIKLHNFYIDNEGNIAEDHFSKLREQMERVLSDRSGVMCTVTIDCNRSPVALMGILQ